MLRLEQWATGVVIMTIMSMFAKRNTPRGNNHVSRTAKALKHRKAKLKPYPD